MNMAIDEVMARFVGEGLSDPILRLYGWNPATLSLGYFQKTDKEVDETGLHSWNIGMVRRFTGGRAVLHDDEVTYSIALPSSSPFFKSNVIDSYRVLSIGLCKALELLGLEPTLQKSKIEPDEHTSAACFDAPSLYELTLGGKKVVGSAQKRFTHSLLQHGSIPITMNIEKLFDTLKFDSDEKKNKLKQIFSRKASWLNAHRQRPILRTELCAALVKGLEEAMQVTFITKPLTDDELQQASALASSKFSTTEWNRKF